MLRKFVRQLRPTQENYIAPIEKVQDYLFELTVTPHYQQKGVYNPYYTLDIDIEKDIIDKNNVKQEKKKKDE